MTEKHVTIIQRVGESPGVMDPLLRQEPLRYMQNGVICPKPQRELNKEDETEDGLREFGFTDISICAECEFHVGIHDSNLMVVCKFEKEQKQVGDENGRPPRPDSD
jgi:hypothetical protein